MNPPDIQKLESLDEVGNRKFIVPAEVRGFFHQWRVIVRNILIVVFLGIPWTTMNGMQTLWLNIPKREFYIFGLHLSAHDTPLIFMFLIISTLGLAFVTAVFGRVWCGWACPQTVFIEGVYRFIERVVEGDYLARRKLRAQSMSANKLFKLVVKWSLFVFASSIIAHSFLAYFIGREPLLQMMQSPPSENQFYFVMIVALTALLTFNFAWFREQFCVIMCPYGRIQSLLMDKNSLTVMYDAIRGEPRKGVATPEKKQGDCVSCLRCVQVCPTGIDIRNGLQMECIGCTACIDACDEIMTKLNKPKGLIGYKRLSGEGFRFFQVRPMLYLVGVFVASSTLAWSLANRNSVDITVIRTHESPYQVAKDENGLAVITNHLRLKVFNQSEGQVTIRTRIERTDVQMISSQSEWTLNSNERKSIDLFLRFAPLTKLAQSKVDVDVEILRDGRVIETQKTQHLLLQPMSEL